MTVTFPARCTHGKPPELAWPNWGMRKDLWCLSVVYDCPRGCEWDSDELEQMPAVARDDRGRAWWRAEDEVGWTPPGGW